MNATEAAASALAGVPPLTPEQKGQWNMFVDYVDKLGYKGSPMLDDKNKGLGMHLINQYRKENPNFSLTYDNVKDVQTDLQDYRNDMVNQFKAGKIVVDGVKSENDIMSGLSPVDGWLGSKTSSWKFPTAVMTIDGKKKDFGVDVDAYAAAAQAYKGTK